MYPSKTLIIHFSAGVSLSEPPIALTSDAFQFGFSDNERLRVPDLPHLEACWLAVFSAFLISLAAGDSDVIMDDGGSDEYLTTS